MSQVDIRVVADADEAAHLVAERLAEQARAGGSVVLTGGTTPRMAYELGTQPAPDWSVSAGISALCTAMRSVGEPLT